MTCIESSAPTIAQALRGNRHSRPPADTSSAYGLRAMLEDGIFALFGVKAPAATIIVRASSLHQVHQTTDLSLSPLGRIRGVLVSHLLRLLSVGVRPPHPYEDAVAAWRASEGTSELITHFEQLDAEELARLATDVTAHAVTLTRELGEIGTGWMPRSAVRATQRLSDGRVILRDVIDLMVGMTSDVASVALFDVSTSPLGEAAERILRYHALVHTLRTSVVPLRSSMFSTATGELWTRDIDFELLARSVDDVLGVVRDNWMQL